MAKQSSDKKIKIIAWVLFFMVLAATLIAESFIKINVIFSIEGRMFFYAWYGLISCTIIVLFSKILGFFIKRKEGYYKENSE